MYPRLTESTQPKSYRSKIRPVKSDFDCMRKQPSRKLASTWPVIRAHVAAVPCAVLSRLVDASARDL